MSMLKSGIGGFLEQLGKMASAVGMGQVEAGMKNKTPSEFMKAWKETHSNGEMPDWNKDVLNYKAVGSPYYMGALGTKSRVPGDPPQPNAASIEIQEFKGAMGRIKQAADAGMEPNPTDLAIAERYKFGR